MPEVLIESVLQETIEKQRIDLEVLRTEKQVLTEVNEQLTAVNTDLTAKIEALSAPKTIAEAVTEQKEEVKLPTDVFIIDKVKYKFISPVFSHNSKRIAATAAMSDKALLAELVKLGSGVIAKA